VRDFVESLPPNSLEAREVRVREERLVFSRSRDFCALSFSASPAEFARQRRVFRRLLDTLRVSDGQI
jgi:hypothetical protein